MPDSDLIKQLFDKKIIRVISVFVKNKKKQFYLREISRLSNVSPATTYRILKKLLNAKVIREIRIGKFKAYEIIDDQRLKALEGLIKEEPRPLDEFIHNISLLDGIDSVILHGKATPKSANLLVIGKDETNAQVSEIASKIKKEHRFSIDFLILSDMQFSQMNRLGVYSGEKQVLWKKPGTSS